MLPILERTDTTVDVVHITDPEVKVRSGLRVMGAVIADEPVPVQPGGVLEARAIDRGADVTHEPVDLTADTAHLSRYGGWLLADTECDRVGPEATRLTLAPLNGPAAARAMSEIRRETSDGVYAYLRSGVVRVRGAGGLEPREVVERLHWPIPAAGLLSLVQDLTAGGAQSDRFTGDPPDDGGDADAAPKSGADGA